MTSSTSAAVRWSFARIARTGFLLLMVAAGCLPSGTFGADALKQQIERAVAAQPAPAPAVPRAAAPAIAETVEPICDVFANGYDPTGAAPCPACFDGTMNFDETDVDCGGTYCKACADGKGCAVNTDCTSTVCNSSSLLCAPATCADGIKDGNETAVDCGGGVCNACSNGLGCVANSDCQSNACDAVSTLCVSSQCIDHKKDGAETDIDCGGGTCPTCAVGKGCSADADCSSGSCDFITGVCASSHCTDQRKDVNETGVDCGGGTCPSCANGVGCLVDADCVSNACDANSNLCVASQCNDHHKDGLETGIDCGGGICNACAAGQGCLVDSDCVSNACDAISNLCVVNQCSDHRKDGLETDIDCGGANSCSRCGAGKTCNVAGDCASGICISHVCN